MSDELDDDLDDIEGGSQLVKDLRRQLKAMKKERDDLASVANEFKAEQRKNTVAKALEARGANPKLARFFDQEDSSSEAVNAWLDENAELFGIPAPESEQDAETHSAAARISQATSRAPQQTLGTPGDIRARMEAAKTPAEWQAIVGELANVKVPQ